MNVLGCRGRCGGEIGGICIDAAVVGVKERESGVSGGVFVTIGPDKGRERICTEKIEDGWIRSWWC